VRRAVKSLISVARAPRFRAQVNRNCRKRAIALAARGNKLAHSVNEAARSAHDLARPRLPAPQSEPAGDRAGSTRRPRATKLSAPDSAGRIETKRKIRRARRRARRFDGNTLILLHSALAAALSDYC
jgi:hypothetical protein